MHVRARLFVLAAAVLFPSVSYSQDSTAASNVSASVRVTPVSPGPTIEGSATAFRLANASADSASIMLQQRQSMGRPIALMVVGGAAILVGAVIGDAPGTLFMIGGAIALLYGLYQYLQ